MIVHEFPEIENLQEPLLTGTEKLIVHQGILTCDEIVTKTNISLEQLIKKTDNPEWMYLCTQALEVNDISLAISQLPQAIDVTTLDQETLVVLNKFLGLNLHQELLQRLVGKIDLANGNNQNGIALLRKLVLAGYDNDVWNLLPQTIDLSCLHTTFVTGFLVGFINASFSKVGYAEQIIQRIATSGDINALSIGGIELLIQLAANHFEQQVVDKLSHTLDFAENNHRIKNLFQLLISRGYAKTLLDNNMPNNFNSDGISLTSGAIAGELIKQGFHKEMFDRIPNPLNLESLSDGYIEIFKQLIKLGMGLELINKLPDLVNLHKYNLVGINVLLLLVERGFASKILEKIPTPLDFSVITQTTFLLLSVLQRKLGTKDMDKLLPSKIIPSAMSNSAGQFLLLLAQDGWSKHISVKLEKGPVDYAKISPRTGMLMRFLFNTDSTRTLENDYPPIPLNLTSFDQQALDNLTYQFTESDNDSIFELLPNKIDCTTISFHAAYFLKLLIKKGYSQEIITRLVVPVKMSKLGEATALVLNSLILKLNHEVVYKLIDFDKPFSLALHTVENNTRDLFISLIESGYQTEVLAHLPTTLDLETITVEASEILSQLIEHGFATQILDLVPDNFDIATVGNGGRNVIQSLVAIGQGSVLIERSKNSAQSNPRKSFGADLLNIQTQAGPYLFEQIQQFPIIPESLVEVRNGWYRAEVKKDGSTSYVFLQLIGKSVKILFRTDNIDKDSLEVYRLASNILPTFISSPNYPELTQDGLTQPSFRFNGFREVYAGPTLAMLTNTGLPKAIMDNILYQQQYIRNMLALHNINFDGYETNHDHDNNYNVRFLLKTETGEKAISFDANFAIQLAQHYHLTITPIVILRDFDQASRIN